MNISIHELTTDSPLEHLLISDLEAKLHELEDTYAECLADDVDAQTLTMLWTRIRVIKKEIAVRLAG